MKGKRESTIQIGLVLKAIPMRLFLECTRIQKSQERLDKHFAQATKHVFCASRNYPSNARGNIIRGRTRYHS